MHSRPGCRYAVYVLCACFAITAMTPQATAAQSRKPQPKQPIAVERSDSDHGAFLLYGNYCGPGNRPGTRPIDALDAACMHHDACAPADGLPSCACNERLQHEAAAVAQNPVQPPHIQFLASFTAASAVLLLCQRSQPAFQTRQSKSRQQQHGQASRQQASRPGSTGTGPDIDRPCVRS